MRARAMGLLLFALPLLACGKASEGTPDAGAHATDGRTSETLPAGWNRVEPAFEGKYGTKPMLHAQDGGCPSGWAATWVEPGCDDLRAHFCSCNDFTKCERSENLCLQHKCSCSGTLVPGCGAFRAPFGPGVPRARASEAGTPPRAGDSCDLLDAGNNSRTKR